MKPISRLLLSLTAVAACAVAQAAPFDAADQARRDQNREEVMARHGLNSTSYRADGSPKVAEKKTFKSETNKAVDATKNFGHRTADKMRDIGAKTDAKFDHKATPSKGPYNNGPQ